MSAMASMVCRAPTSATAISPSPSLTIKRSAGRPRSVGICPETVSIFLCSSPSTHDDTVDRARPVSRTSSALLFALPEATSNAISLGSSLPETASVHGRSGNVKRHGCFVDIIAGCFIAILSKIVAIPIFSIYDKLMSKFDIILPLYGIVRNRIVRITLRKQRKAQQLSATLVPTKTAIIRKDPQWNIQSSRSR